MYFEIYVQGSRIFRPIVGRIGIKCEESGTLKVSVHFNPQIDLFSANLIQFGPKSDAPVFVLVLAWYGFQHQLYLALFTSVF